MMLERVWTSCGANRLHTRHTLKHRHDPHRMCSLRRTARPQRAAARGGVPASQARKHLGLALAAPPPRERATPLGGAAGSPRSRLARCWRLRAAREARSGSADNPRPKPWRQRDPTHRCVRCHTRYCNATCQHAHWKDGHKLRRRKFGRRRSHQPGSIEGVDAAAQPGSIEDQSGRVDRPPGHKKLCKKIARAGGAETYHAGLKAKEAAAEAVAASAADVRGDASCHICRMATGEGLVRACACHGATFETAGLAHVSCLVHQAQVAVSVGTNRSNAPAQYLGA